METIKIEYNSNNYLLKISIEKAFPYGYYKIEWTNEELLKVITSPVYFEKDNTNRIKIPPFNNMDELTLFSSIAKGILFKQLNDAKI